MGIVVLLFWLEADNRLPGGYHMLKVVGQRAGAYTLVTACEGVLDTVAQLDTPTSSVSVTFSVRVVGGTVRIWYLYFSVDGGPARRWAERQSILPRMGT